MLQINSSDRWTVDGAFACAFSLFANGDWGENLAESGLYATTDSIGSATFASTHDERGHEDTPFLSDSSHLT
jgi:hypothetical protein